MTAVEAQKIRSVVCFAAAAVLIFVAPMLAGRNVQPSLNAKMDRSHLRRQHGNFWFDLAAALGLESQRGGTKNAAGLSCP